MDHQLRIYAMKPGRMDEFLALWRDHVVPARQAHGFEIVSAWINREADEFAWIVRSTGPEGFAEADEAYYRSPERTALPWNPLDAIASVQLHMVEPYSP